jgi:hypothetical protein
MKWLLRGPCGLGGACRTLGVGRAELELGVPVESEPPSFATFTASPTAILVSQ